MYRNMNHRRPRRGSAQSEILPPLSNGRRSSVQSDVIPETIMIGGEEVKFRAQPPRRYEDGRRATVAIMETEKPAEVGFVLFVC